MMGMQTGVQRVGLRRAKPTIGAMVMRTTRARRARQRGLGQAPTAAQAAVAAQQAYVNATEQSGVNSSQAQAALQQLTNINQQASTAVPTAATTSSTTYIIAGIIGVLVVGGLVYFATE
jgi:hypothetical protein